MPKREGVYSFRKEREDRFPMPNAGNFFYRPLLGNYWSPPLPEVDRTAVSTFRDRQTIVALALMVGAGLLTLSLTQGFEFLVSISVIFVVVEGITAINFYLLTPSAQNEHGFRSHYPFRFRTTEELVLSVFFTLIGVATLIGVLRASELAGWLSISAGVLAAANVVATRLSVAARRGYDGES